MNEEQAIAKEERTNKKRREEEKRTQERKDQEKDEVEKLRCELQKSRCELDEVKVGSSSGTYLKPQLSTASWRALTPFQQLLLTLM